MSTLLCINPLCRSGELFDTESAVARLEALGPVVLHDLSAAGDPLDIVEQGEFERIVVGGGDGTLNRCLPAVRAAAVPFGVLPLGTANDFARSLDLPLDPQAAIEVILAGGTKRVSLGQANGRWFLNAAGVGLGPELTKTLDREKKRRLGVLAYLDSLIEVVGDRRRGRAVIHVNGTSRPTRFIQITVANGVHYGGGLTAAHDASLDDGELRILLLKPQTLWSLMKKLFAMRWGRGPRQGEPELLLYHAKEVRIETAAELDVTLDGELVGTTPLACRCVPDAIEVYAPKVARETPELASEPSSAESRPAEVPIRDRATGERTAENDTADAVKTH